jgi:hypothetical protein
MYEATCLQDLFFTGYVTETCGTQYWVVLNFYIEPQVLVPKKIRMISVWILKISPSSHPENIDFGFTYKWN